MTEFAFAAEVIHWRGPAPFFFVPLPAQQAEQVRQLARRVSYGWGMIPVSVTIWDVTFTTALFAKNDTYYLPLKASVREKVGVTAGDRVAVRMEIGRSCQAVIRDV